MGERGKRDEKEKEKSVKTKRTFIVIWDRKQHN